MNQAQMFCPASITLLFKVHPHKNLLKMGSTGVGFTIDKGVTAIITKSKKTVIQFNGKRITFPTVLSVANELTAQTVSIDLHSFLPLGNGFGLSSASALSAGFALNKLLALKKTKHELIETAYKAEVVNKTGLGSVTTQTIGGFLVKKTPGLSPKFTRLPFVGKKFYAIIISKIETPKVLKNKATTQAINRAAQKYLSQFKSDASKNLDEIFDLSYLFAKKSGLITDKIIKEIIQRIHNDGHHATITMLGNVILTTKRPKNEFGYRVIQLKITEKTIK